MITFEECIELILLTVECNDAKENKSRKDKDEGTGVH